MGGAEGGREAGGFQRERKRRCVDGGVRMVGRGTSPEDEVQVLVCDQNTNPMLEKKSMTHQKKQKELLGSLLTHVL